uniref:F-box domain-containing protein n=1 Tax=Caenorhabditis tropicalis TaxID=1561998 RepID=A0A1I7UZ83_9PELO
MTPLLLLQLPHVVTREIINQFELGERFILSLCSKRSQKFVRMNQSKTSKWNMCLTCEDSVLSIGVGRENVDQIVKLRRLRILLNKNQNLERILIGDRAGLFLQTRDACEVGVGSVEKSDFRFLVDYLCDIFDTRPTVIHTYPGHLWLINMYRNPMDLIHIHSTDHPLTRDEIRTTFHSCQINELQLDAEIDRGSQSIYFGLVKKIDIRNWRWTTVENFMNIAESCQEIYANTPWLIDEFIKHWMKGNMTKFRFMIIDFTVFNWNLARIFKDLEQDQIYVAQRMECVIDGRVYVIKPGTKAVRRRDGRVLGVDLTDHSLVVTVV